MKRSLDEIIIDGIDTNIELHKWILNQKDFMKVNIIQIGLKKIFLNLISNH